MSDKSPLSKEALAKTHHWHDNCRQSISKKDWNITFLEQAFLWAERSHDVQTKHGAVLTTDDHRIIATGYNGFVRNICDDVLPNLRPEKYRWMTHSEIGCILDCAYQGKSSKNSIMYVTGEPCLQCYQLMYQAGVKKVIYGNNNSHMLNTDIDYKTNVEIFLWLVKDNFSSIHIDYPKNS